ncbi:MAG TPA: ribonuclease P protein component [Candidatus Cloacimonetes bacterium]|nr:ribonuclease P protein component [Candidatus Cloacimonadota bacterium]
MRFIISTREYESVYQKNTKLENELFIFLVQKEIPEQEIPEKNFAVGIVVSKKVGISVIRNKVKRRIKAFLREKKECFPTNTKIVIIAKQKAGNADWLGIKQHLSELFNRI